MSKSKCIFLNGLIDLAQSRLGSKVVFKTDEFFASASRIINPMPPIFKEGVFDKHGKWMDGCLGGWIGGWMDSGWIEFSTLPVQAMPFIVIFPHLRIVK